MIRAIHPALAAASLAAVVTTAALAASGGTEAIDLAWKKAMVANDVEGVMQCYAPDAVAWLPEMPEARGATAIREAYKQFLAGNTIRDVTFTDTHYENHGDRAVGWGRFTLTLVPKKGDDKPVTMSGRFTEVAIKRDGRWVYSVDHASAEPAPTVGAPAK
jgi:uncharacterized protein (TIGR02246 family)